MEGCRRGCRKRGVSKRSVGRRWCRWMVGKGGEGGKESGPEEVDGRLLEKEGMFEARRCQW